MMMAWHQSANHFQVVAEEYVRVIGAHRGTRNVPDFRPVETPPIAMSLT
jgi:hypothetical protein